jgi:DNA-binding NarL/FixJ family response regulator
MIRIVVAEDQALLRDMLRQAVSADQEIKVVAVASNGNEAVECCERHRPDIALLDMRMPGAGGLDAAERIRERCPGTRIVILTSFQTDDEIGRAFSIGVNGFLMKDMLPEDLIAALKQVSRNMFVLHEDAYRRVTASFKRAVPTARPAREDATAEPLTAQETDLVRCIVRGMSNKEAAASLNLSEGTVRNIISRILAKTGLQDRTQLAVHAIKENLA